MKDRSGGYVIDREFDRRNCLFDGVCGEPNYDFGWQKLSRFTRRQVVLAEMYSVGTERYRYIDAVIHDQRRVMCAGHRLALFDDPKQLAGAHRFVSYLNESRAARNKRFYLFEM